MEHVFRWLGRRRLDLVLDRQIVPEFDTKGRLFNVLDEGGLEICAASTLQEFSGARRRHDAIRSR